jgi:hypothetical protein
MVVPTMTATAEVVEPPTWAVLQRRLVDEIDDAVEPVIDRYVEDDGSVLWPPGDDYVGMDALDDAYESFWNWPLYYALGGGEHVFQSALEGWEAITDQFAEIPTGLGFPQVHREYQQGHDWFHQSEGNQLFYNHCLAAPSNERLADLATRFAGFYLNEDPAVPDNYDPETDRVRSPMNGSRGPAVHNFSEEIPPAMYGAHSETRIPWAYEEWKEQYGLPFYDLEGVDTVDDLRDPDAARRMGEAIRDRCARGDVPLNLAITSLVLNAYLFTGEEKYADWIRDYHAAWAERTERNGGVIPDNVGPSDEIGELIDGRWFGGWYGWVWPHGWHSFGNALVAAAENAALVSGGETSYLDLPRSQLDMLAEEGYEEDGTLHVPFQYATAGEYPADHGQEPAATATGQAGWFNYGPIQPEDPTHLWFVSQQAEDRERLRRFRSTGPDDWDEGLETHMKTFGGNEYAWTAYLAGDYPAYPERILEHDLAFVRDRRAFVREDDQDPETYGDYYLADRNPVAVEGLLHCTTGSPLPLWNGGFPSLLVRHFDPDRGRPGLPPGVAALVDAVESDAVSLTLVNADEDRRRLLVQAGGFGEHRFTTASGAGDTVDVDGPRLAVVLPPRTEVHLDLGVERYARDPAHVDPTD